MTMNYSQSVAERAIPVKSNTTGKDAQSYRKEKADCMLSEGMMGDEYALSPGVLIDGEKQESMFLTQVTVNFPLNTQVVVQCILLTFTQ